MKSNIHPKYKEIKVVCSCGNTFTTGSTYEGDELHLDICANCHPFYTGQQKIVDTAGRVDLFKKKYSSKPVKEKPPKDELVLQKAVKKPTTKSTAAKKAPVVKLKKVAEEKK
jgi:large subunit ribosomal protein L31